MGHHVFHGHLGGLDQAPVDANDTIGEQAPERNSNSGEEEPEVAVPDDGPQEPVAQAEEVTPKQAE